jgi:hypothetical protein
MSEAAAARDHAAPVSERHYQYALHQMLAYRSAYQAVLGLMAVVGVLITTYPGPLTFWGYRYLLFATLLLGAASFHLLRRAVAFGRMLEEAEPSLQVVRPRMLTGGALAALVLLANLVILVFR